jgi:hypothetical protein
MMFLRDEMVRHEMKSYPDFEDDGDDWFYNLATTADGIDLLLFGA